LEWLAAAGESTDVGALDNRDSEPDGHGAHELSLFLSQTGGEEASLIALASARGSDDDRGTVRSPKATSWKERNKISVTVPLVRMKSIHN